ncbi:MAG: FAD:protein FMN transferase [Actinomycetota bacterium]
MDDFASVSLEAIGTTAQVVCPTGDIAIARGILERELRAIDEACSRFRDDSELARVNATAGAWTVVSPLFAQALSVALRAARLTDGIVVPTVGRALVAAGYDRDFALIPPDVAEQPAAPVADWRAIEVDPSAGLVRIPPDASLDFGATAKALAADRAARAVGEATGGNPVLVNLGGDIAVSGEARGWSVKIADDHRALPTDPGPEIVITSGGLATSSTVVRRWRRGARDAHHIIDPATGCSAGEVWRTVSVAAGTCVDANTAATASIVLGERAPAWLAEHGLPARLVRPDETVARVAGWPLEREAS